MSNPTQNGGFEVVTGSCGWGGVATPHTQPSEDPMTDDRLPLAELLAKTGDADFLRSAAEAVVQLIMEADVEGGIAPISWTVCRLAGYGSARAVSLSASQVIGERHPRAKCSLAGLYHPSM